MGIRLDPAPSNVASFRYYSFDPDAYFNHAAKTYTRILQKPKDTYKPANSPLPATDNAAKVEAILGQIEAHGADITGVYLDWFAIGCGLASEFGESGRDYFHRVSQYHPEYRPVDTDRCFSQWLRKPAHGYSIATFFEIAKQRGFFPGAFETSTGSF